MVVYGLAGRRPAAIDQVESIFSSSRFWPHLPGLSIARLNDTQLSIAGVVEWFALPPLRADCQLRWPVLCAVMAQSFAHQTQTQQTERERENDRTVIDWNQSPVSGEREAPARWCRLVVATLQMARGAHKAMVTL